MKNPNARQLWRISGNGGDLVLRDFYVMGKTIKDARANAQRLLAPGSLIWKIELDRSIALLVD
jgi:hypothetical protein